MTEPRPLPMSRTTAAATDLLVGIAAGLTAALTMNLFQAAWTRISAPPQSPTATENAADAVAETLAGKSAKPKARKSLANAIHYTTGAVLGGLYGVGSGLVPALTWGSGTVFAGAVWAVGDELAVSGLGLGPTPAETDPKDHAFGLASHIVFGLTLDLVRRQLNGLISARR